MGFNFDILDPTDVSIVAQFPANERVFRTTIQNYLGVEHDSLASTSQGYHSFQIGTNTTRAGFANPPPGMLFYSTTDVQLEINTGTAIAPVWSSTGSVPAGTVLPFAGGVAPAGYVFCDGSAISRTTFSNLFAAIGTTYGVGDGSTTFNVPDLRGRVVAGFDSGNATGRLNSAAAGGIGAAGLGQVGGEQAHADTINELPVHNHAATSIVSDAGHTHQVSGSVIAAGGFPAVGSFSNGTGSAGTSSLNASGVSVSTTISNAGAGVAHNNVQPTIILNYLIKT